MIRVLQIGMTDNLGGIETFLINYYRNINHSKFQFDFINIYQNKLCFEDEIISLGGKVYNVTSYYRHPIKFIKEIKKIIKENNYEIIHCNMNSAVMLFPLIAAKLAKCKMIISHSHNSSSDKGFIKELMHNINRHFIPLFANYYFSCSDLAGNWFFSKKIINSDRYYVINNAIEIDKFIYDENMRIKKRKELKINKDTTIFGHVGRFNKQKNHTFLIDVFYEYLKKKPNSILLLIGQGPLEDKIKEKTENLGIRDKVLFLGKRSDVNELYKAMDVFLLPSIYEGLPLVGIEAQISGLPCVFSSNISKEIKISSNAYFCKIDNTSEFVNKILNLSLREKNFVDFKKYDIKACSKKLEKLYLLFEENN